MRGGFYLRKFIPLALISSILLTGCAGGFIRGKVESAIRDALPTYIGPARQYTVRVDGSSNKMLHGKIKHIHIEGTDVQVDPNITVSHAIVDMDDVKYNMKAHELKQVRNAVFQAQVTESNINNYLKKAQLNGMSPKVSLQPDQITAEIEASFAGISVPVHVTGRPVIVDGNKIDFSADNVSVAHLPIPMSVVNGILAKINPIYDFSTLRLPVTLEKVDVEQGSFTLNGHALFPTVSTK